MAALSYRLRCGDQSRGSDRIERARHRRMWHEEFGQILDDVSEGAGLKRDVRYK